MGKEFNEELMKVEKEVVVDVNDGAILVQRYVYGSNQPAVRFLKRAKSGATYKLSNLPSQFAKVLADAMVAVAV